MWPGMAGSCQTIFLDGLLNCIESNLPQSHGRLKNGQVTVSCSVDCSQIGRLKLIE